MTAQQLQSEITRSLDQLPEGVLQNILDLIKAAKAQQKDDANWAANLSRILREDRALLERLAK